MTTSARHSRPRAHSWEPSKQAVLATASAAGLVLCGIAGIGVAHEHSTVNIEVDGVIRPVSTWAHSVSGVLNEAGVEVAEHDLVQPSIHQQVSDGQTIVVRTAKPYTLSIDGSRKTLWSTAPSAEGVLADMGVDSGKAILAVDRSQSRSSLTPLVSQTRQVKVIVDGNTRTITAREGMDTRSILEKEGITLSPLDRVEVKSTAEGLSIDIHKVTRSLAPRKVAIPFEEHRQDSDQLFAGEEQVTTKGVEGEAEEMTWSENVDGGERFEAPLNSKVVREPSAQIRSIGTKEVTPKALIEAGLDPKATLEEKTEEDGTRSIRYRAKLGTLSSAAEITAAGGNSAEVAQAMVAANIPLTYSGEDPRSLAKPLVAARGWGDSEFQCLVALWNRESHWNPYAKNASSGAYGIPQALPGSKMASAGADWQTNPVTQIKWGLGYIAGRYGRPCSALAHSNSVGWY